MTIQQTYEYKGHRFTFLADGSDDLSGVIVNTHAEISKDYIKALKHAQSVFIARMRYMRAFDYFERDGVEMAFRDPSTEYTDEYKQYVLEQVVVYERIREEQNARKTKYSKRTKILKRDNYTCQNPHCGHHDPTGENLHIDHVIPSSRGGNNMPDNLQVLCWQCNRDKHTMTMDEFLTSLEAGES